MRRKHQQKKQNLNNRFFQDKIKKNLLIIGKSAILEIIQKFPESADFFVYSDESDKRIANITRVASENKVRSLEDKQMIREISSDLGEKTSNCLILKYQPIKTFSLGEFEESFEKFDNIRCVAIPEVDYPQNLGAMIRTCYALGVDFVLVPNSQIDVFSSTVTKISMGYNYLIPIVQDNFIMAIETLRKFGFKIYGLDMEGENIQKIGYNSRVCFIVGNESRGLSETLKKKTDFLVRIPMRAEAESFNVSVSLGIALYDIDTKIDSSNTN